MKKRGIMFHKIKYLDNRGIAIVWLGLFLFALLLVFAGLAIDIWHMVNVKNGLGIAADAGALAGAGAGLSGTDNSDTDLTQETARQAAWRFACKNKVADSNVYLVTNNPADCNTVTPPLAANLNGVNDPNGDIVVGHWTLPPAPTCANCICEAAGSGFFCLARGSANPTNLPINAIKVVSRRAAEGAAYGMGPVRVFFGPILGLFKTGPGDATHPVGTGWFSMSAKASAIASGGPINLTGINVCLDTCNLNPSDASPISLDVREQTAGSPYGLAWSQLDQNASIGTQACVNNTAACVLASDCATNDNKKVAATIWDLINPPLKCGDSITSKNGVATVLDDLQCAFKSTSFDTQNKDIVGGVVNKWRIIVPIQTQCPAGSEPGPWQIVRFAQIEIKGVFDTGTLKGIQITKIKCVACPDVTKEFGGHPVLVK